MNYEHQDSRGEEKSNTKSSKSTKKLINLKP